MILSGQSAFHALAALVRGQSAIQPDELEDPALRRTACVVRDIFGASSLDRAVLLRQTLRYAELNPDLHVAEPRLLVQPGLVDHRHWSLVGIRSRRAVEGTWIEASPWRPQWLPSVGEAGADAATGEFQRRDLPGAPGDPFLKRLKRERYQSAGQRAAVRAALTAPPGAVLVVCLPTGEGKSFIFQTISEIGLGDRGVSSGPGVTLVVTPTVALAQDHERASLDVGMPDQPRAYIGGESARNALLYQRVAEGTQGLLFASPEAACGPLRRALEQAAQAGALRALVVDEAHLVDAWGAEFRPEFQALSGLRRTLLRASAATTPIRTLLLSATYTEATMQTLRALFAPEDGKPPTSFGVVAAPRLRPEPDYWVASVTYAEERDRRVMEAMLHVPRPAVLYTTEVAEAEQWFARLRDYGFSRVACVTGQTRSDARALVVDRWRAGTLDVVVATSAFGLGIDNSHVRSIVHGCIPETLDRFYQEVGRGGRDGRSCLSLVIPSSHDFDVAASLNRVKLVTVDVGRERWSSMFHGSARVRHENGDLTLPLDVAPTNTPDRIDMRSSRNTDWNKRTLALMASSGLLTLEGPVTSRAVHGHEARDEDAAEGRGNAFQTVRIAHPGHLEADTWLRVVEARRTAIEQANAASLRRIGQYIREPEKVCLADHLTPLYRVSRDACGEAGDGYAIEVAAACGGCPACRAQGRTRSEEPVATPELPWPLRGDLLPPADRLLDATQRLLVFYEEDPSRLTPRQRGDVIGAFATLIRSGVASVHVEQYSVEQEDLAAAVGAMPFFLAHGRDARFLPPGPTLVLVGPQGRVTESLLASHGPGRGRIVVLSATTPDLELPGQTLRARYPHRTMSLADLLTELHL